MVALLLLASRAERGSYGAPDIVPESSAMSAVFSGMLQELPENKNVDWSTTYPRVLYTTLWIIVPVDPGFR